MVKSIVHLQGSGTSYTPRSKKTNNISLVEEELSHLDLEVLMKDNANGDNLAIVSECEECGV